MSDRISLIMHENGLNQERFSEILNVSQPAISNYLKGRIPPPLVLLKMSVYSGRSMEWILSGEDNIKHVAEKTAGYIPHSEFLKKFSALPAKIQKDIIKLIDSISEIYHK